MSCTRNLNYTSTCYADPHNILGHLGAAVIVFIISSGALGNLLVIIAVASFVKLRRSYNIFIASLAANDLVFNVVIMPFYADTYIYRHWRFSRSLCRFETFFGTTVVIASSLHIAVIAINRYLLIVHKNRYTKCFRQVAIVLQIVGIWFTSASIVLPGILGWEAVVEYSDQIGRCSYVRSSSKGSLSIVFGLGFIIPCLTIVICYIKISMVVFRSKQKLAQYHHQDGIDDQQSNISPPQTETHRLVVMSTSIGTLTELDDSRVRRSDKPMTPRCPQRSATPSRTKTKGNLRGKFSILRKMQMHSHNLRYFKSFKMILAVFLGFLLSYLPFTLLNFADQNSCLCRHWYMSTSLLFWAGSCVNPWIYGALNPQFRQAYRDIICSCIKKRL